MRHRREQDRRADGEARGRFCASSFAVMCPWSCSITTNASHLSCGTWCRRRTGPRHRCRGRAASAIAGAMISISSRPNSPPSPACGLRPLDVDLRPRDPEPPSAASAGADDAADAIAGDQAHRLGDTDMQRAMHDARRRNTASGTRRSCRSRSRARRSSDSHRIRCRRPQSMFRSAAPPRPHRPRPQARPRSPGLRARKRRQVRTPRRSCRTSKSRRPASARRGRIDPAGRWRP